MNKQEILSEYKNQEDKLLLSFVLDKIKFVETKNKIQHTNFLNIQEQSLVEIFLHKIKYTNYVLWGGYENAERKALILYPEKLTIPMVVKNYNKIIEIIRIELPEIDYGKYKHKNYLGGIVKLGMNREKVGDISVKHEGADIIILSEVKNILIQELPTLKRFEKANITEQTIENLQYFEPKIEKIKIIVPSLRLDNFVSDLAKTSRNKAIEIIKNERVFVNGKLETKTSKQIKPEDVITIRGKGRFTIINIEGTTRSGRSIVSVDKFA